MKLILLKNSKGQSAIEYILMLLVVTTLITSLTTYMKNKYLGDATKCNLPANKTKFLCKINSFLEPTGGNKRFQYFPFKK